MENSRRTFIKISGLGLCSLLAAPGKEVSSFFQQEELPDLLTGENGSGIRSVQEWQLKREKIRSQWCTFLGLIPDKHGEPFVKEISVEIVDGVKRQFIEYENEPGESAVAYILKPQNATGSLPGIVALHSTSDNEMKYIAGVIKGDIPPGAFNLAKLGFLVICPQCYLWRDKGGRSYEEQADRFMLKHPGSKGMAGMLYDAMRAVDILETLPEVDRSRIGAFGHSLGAKESLYLGAFDERVKVIVSNEGGIGIDFTNWNDSWYLGKQINSFGHQHHEILALCAPKPFLLIGGSASDGEKSRKYIDAVKPVYKLYGKEHDLEFFNHGKGHNIVPEADKAAFDWLTDHLGAK